ncbi:hypothetical protein BDV59DRAFT_174786 [Aspergillus ambiguus]|uniref:uncharacterized protein n=1 Tax=Aspergillus ambiguus TaxID=176160 RepID=UPI003CCDDF66
MNKCTHVHLYSSCCTAAFLVHTLSFYCDNSCMPHQDMSKYLPSFLVHQPFNQRKRDQFHLLNTSWRSGHIAHTRSATRVYLHPEALNGSFQFRKAGNVSLWL